MASKANEQRKNVHMSGIDEEWQRWENAIHGTNTCRGEIGFEQFVQCQEVPVSPLHPRGYRDLGITPGVPNRIFRDKRYLTNYILAEQSR